MQWPRRAPFCIPKHQKPTVWLFYWDIGDFHYNNGTLGVSGVIVGSFAAIALGQAITMQNQRYFHTLSHEMGIHIPKPLKSYILGDFRGSDIKWVEVSENHHFSSQGTSTSSISHWYL